MERCSFCGKSIKKVYRLIKSCCVENVYICDSCSEAVYKVMSGQINSIHTNNKKPDNRINFNMTPRQIHQELDKYIIGQEQAKKVLSVAVYNHNKRHHDDTGLIKKSNILIAGPSGSGKTLLARSLAKLLNLPFVTVDATSLTEAGYVGNDVEICLQRLLEKADGDIELAQKGIVYIDEIDKIARIGESRSATRDVSGEGVQQALLKLIEGCEVSVPVSGNRKIPSANSVKFDTANVLFICGGAFPNLYENQDRKNPIGFNRPGIVTKDLGHPKLSHELLVGYGLLREFVGRFPILCQLQELDEDSLVQILTQPKDAITKEYALLFEKEGIKLEYDEDALRQIAGQALAQNTGARGLRSIMEELMLDIMYEIPDRKDISKCIITKESIKTKEPVIIPKRK